jgi:hypothetical protein
LINNFPASKEGKPTEIAFTLPRPQQSASSPWVGNTLYNPQERVGLIFDGKDKGEFDVEPNADPQTFAVNPPRTGKEITLQIIDWQHLPGKQSNQGEDIIGIDNFYLKAQRPADFYQKVKPMLNIGGMMQYPRGAGVLLW